LGFLLAWVAVLLPMRMVEIKAWCTVVVCAYPVIEVLYSMVRRRRGRKSSGAPDDMHLHSLVKTQVISKRFPNLSLRMRNSAVAPIIWGFAGLPALAGIVLYKAPYPYLAAVFVAYAYLYHSVYKRLAASRIHDRLQGLLNGSRSQLFTSNDASYLSLPNSSQYCKGGPSFTPIQIGITDCKNSSLDRL
jgi:hypothetical protein